MTRLFSLTVEVLLLASVTHAQEIEKAEPVEKVQPAGTARIALIAVPRGVAREFKLSTTDLVTFRDPRWSVLTLTQIGAATADAVTSINNLNHCSVCVESGPSRIFVGVHPDAHKYIIAGMVEISAEAVTGHYLRRRVSPRKWYWRILWTLPQSLSVYEHARASHHNASLP
jgi:hypothetical protein